VLTAADPDARAISGASRRDAHRVGASAIAAAVGATETEAADPCDAGGRPESIVRPVQGIQCPPRINARRFGVYAPRYFPFGK